MPEKVLINLSTGLEDSERVTVACDGCPPLASFVGNARPAGATPMWEWLGDGPRTVFSY